MFLESENVKFNSSVSMTTIANKRHSSADRIQRRLHSVERNSAGGRLDYGENEIRPKQIRELSWTYSI